MIIIHGDNQVESRKYLTTLIVQAKLKGKEIIRLEGKELNLEVLKQSLEAKSLLGKERYLIIENFLISAPAKEIIDYLIKNLPENFVIWENKEISQTKINQLKAKTKLFKLPPIIFKFLDSFLPGNKKQSLNLLRQTVSQLSSEIVFYMLVRQVRLLLIANQLGQKGLSELHPFQQQKIAFLAKKFKIEELLTIYRKLLYIDWQQKTGQASIDLAGQLDLLIASL